MHADRQRRRRDAGSRSIWRRRFEQRQHDVAATSALPATRKNQTLLFVRLTRFGPQAPTHFLLADCANLAHIPDLMTSLAQAGPNGHLGTIPIFVRDQREIASDGFTRLSFPDLSR